jgi:hypothetical protein
VRGEVLGVSCAWGSPSDCDCDSCSMVKWRPSTALGDRELEVLITKYEGRQAVSFLKVAGLDCARLPVHSSYKMASAPFGRTPAVVERSRGTISSLYIHKSDLSLPHEYHYD